MPEINNLWVWMLFVLFSGEVYGQEAGIYGTVKEVDSNLPVAGATVMLQSDGKFVAGTTTDGEGRYELKVDLSGEYFLEISFVGYKENVIELTINDAGRQQVDVTLIPGIDLNPVIITASRHQEKYLDSPAAISVLDIHEFEQNAAPSVAAVLRNTPGVDLAQAGLDRYQVALRGFNAAFVSKTYAMVDLRQAVTPSMGDNQFSGMPLSALDIAQVEVVKGPGSALYGPGVEQGVIHFITKDPFRFPGTSVSLGAGERQLVQGAIRHAGIISENLGYKIVTQYSQGEDWQLDDAISADSTILSYIAPNIGERDYSTWRGYVSGTLQYQLPDQVSITANGGYSSIKSITLANIGEQQSERFARVFGQLRLDAGNFFAQLYLNKNNAGDTYIYRSGATLIDESTQFTGQVQYNMRLAEGKENLIFGADVKQTNPVTGGTIHGRNESDDAIKEYGAYFQSETILSARMKLVAAGRLDYNSVIKEMQFSPRLGLVYKPRPQHSFRATFNRAFSSPVGVNLFVDFVVRDTGPFLIRARGGAEGWTFADQPATTALVAVPGFDVQDPGVGMSLARAYAAATGILFGPSGPLGNDNAALQSLLLNKVEQIQGMSEGRMAFTAGDNLQFIDSLSDLPPVKHTITNTLEFGYKGLIGDNVAIGLDLYYTRKKNFLSELQFATPFVLTPSIATDLADAVAASFTDAELQSFGFTPAQLAAMYESVGESFAENPIGLVETVENFDAGTRPELMMTFINFGEIDFFGMDIEGHVYLSDALSAFGSLTLVSDNFFDENEAGSSRIGQVVAMNAPRKKVRGGFEYAADNGFSFNASGRYAGAFEVRSGVHQGAVESYFLLDLGAGYDFSSTTPGLRVDVIGQNILNNRHRQYVNAPRLGRLVTARLTYSF